MKTLTSIIAACVILAFAAAAGAATSTYPGTSGSQAVRSTQQKTVPAEYVDARLYRKQTAQLKAAVARNKALTGAIQGLSAKRKDLASSNSYLTGENQRLLDRIVSLTNQLTPVAGPAIVTPPADDQACRDYGDGCTPAQKCEYWGNDCDLVTPPAPPVDEASQGNESG